MLAAWHLLRRGLKTERIAFMAAEAKSHLQRDHDMRLDYQLSTSASVIFVFNVEHIQTPTR